MNSYLAQCELYITIQEI